MRKRGSWVCTTEDRLWCEAADEDERFIAINRIVIAHDATAQEMRLNLYVFADDLSRFGISHSRFLADSSFAGGFREVRTTGSPASRKQVRFEQSTSISYSGRPTDSVQQVVDFLRGKVWKTVSVGKPYRSYYAYLAPSVDRPHLVPQLLGIYAVIFYLGSITRYRPHHFDAILKGEFGAWVREFLAGQPIQFIYLLASEFAQQEVTKPAIV